MMTEADRAWRDKDLASMREAALTIATKMYADGGDKLELTLAQDMAKVVGEMHVPGVPGNLDYYAIDVDEDLFIIKFEWSPDMEHRMTVDWRSYL